MNQQGIGARQRWELGLAVASPVALLVVGVVLLFVPWSRASTCTAIAGGPQSCTSKSETLLEAGIPPEGWALVAMLLAVFLLLPVLAFGDVWLGLSWSRVLLRVVAVVLVLFAFVSGFSIGLFILPGALLAAASAALSSGEGRGGRLAASFD